MKYYSKLTATMLVLGTILMGTGVTTASANSSNPWKVYNWNPSGYALAPQPANLSTSGVSFNFAPGVYAGTLMTTDSTLVGNLTGGSFAGTFSVTDMWPTATFEAQASPCPASTYVRFYFTTPGFAYDNYWWSNPIHVDLANNGTGGVAPTSISTSLSDPTQWSDWNGQVASSSPQVTAAFYAAQAKVNQAGVSFGGGCFFENGVATSDGTGTFTLSGFND